MVGDYISRDAVCYQLKKQESIDGQPSAIRRARRIVAEFPATDVRPVVTCGECIYWEPASPTRISGNCNRSFDIPAWANDFCSYGKRKDRGHDDV